jgi:hypothetical protein
MFGGMGLDAPTAAVLVAAGVIVVCCVAVPRMRRTLLGIVDTLDGIELLFYVLCALVIVAIVSWALVYGLWRLLSGVL